MRYGWFALVLLSGCASRGPHPLRPLEIPTSPYYGLVGERLTGSLSYDGGCLLFRGDSKRVQLVPVWPEGTKFNGTSVIFHEPGRTDETIVINEEFVMSGQRMQWARLPGPRIPLHQHLCGGVPFAVAGVRPAN